VGEPADRNLAIGLDLEEIDDALDDDALLGLLALGGAPADRLLEDVALHLQVASGHEVVQDAHSLEQGQILECAGHAHLRDLARVHVPEGLAAQADRALLRLVDAVDAVEHRALARAVRADDGADFVLADVEADVAQRLDAAEAKADVVHVEDDLAGLSRSHHAARPTAAKVGTSTIFRVAATLPVRPSSNLTWVSTYCSLLPP